MLTDDEKALIRQCMASLRDGIDGFRSRRPQMEMIAAVSRTLARCKGDADSGPAGSNIAVIEAGTGTGKSFGALVPALVLARARSKHLVVSSSTVALQAQYAEKDAPTLQKLLPFPFKVAVAKGRRRYACTMRLFAEADDIHAQTGLALSSVATKDPAEVARRERDEAVMAMAHALHEERWSGDRDEFAQQVPDRVWNEVSTDRSGCAGKDCPRRAGCPFYTARQRVQEAELVIANHDLVLSAIATGGGGVLPAPAETVYVFDEAHSLSAKAIEHFAERHALRAARDWLADGQRAVRDAVLSLGLNKRLLTGVAEHVKELDDRLAELFRLVQGLDGLAQKRALRFKDGVLPAPVAALGASIQAAATGLKKTFALLRETLLERLAADGPTVSRVLSGVGFFAGKVDNLIATWTLLLAGDVGQDVPIARWIELHEGAGDADYLICASPITGSSKLRELLWDKASAAILTSATLTSCGSFDLFVGQAGLDRYDGVSFLQVDSPFDYRANAELVIPAMRSEPTDAAAHTQEVLERLPALIGTRGTLVLFASGKQMREVHARLSEDIRGLVLMQGTMPKSELLARHRAAVDRGEPSVLFGLQSLAEGVDLPGDYCTHLVCSKLPFSVPDSPLEEARREWIEAQGRSSFLEVTLPETAVRLKQQLGRLLRTCEDRGKVTILDRRLVSKRWGALLMKGLPDFRVVIEPSQRTRAGRSAQVA